jgi:hypothetical protein
VLERNKDDLVAGVNAVAKGVGVAQMAYAIYDRFTGKTYSSEDIQKLKILKQMYKDYLNAESPVQWELDDKSCPTHRIQPQNWARYCNELSKRNKNKSIYYHQSKIIAKVASSYLTARSSRSVGGGAEGDLLEQYIGEWVSFALNDLPQLGCTDESVYQLKQRMEYLDQIDSNVSIFDYGTYNRSVTKFDVFDDIGDQLKICVEVALIEKSRTCARNLLDECRNNISALLSDCADVIFYARGKSVDMFAFDLSRFVDVDRRRERAVDVLYKEVRKTHTGKILYDIISLAGVTAFGSKGQSVNLAESAYYLPANYQLKEVDWTSKEMDLFPWVTDDIKQKQMKKIQELGQSMLLIAQIKNLIETAYDLTGIVGDFWAYGDKNGKKSLTALLFLMEKELNLLTQRFTMFYEENKAARKEHSRDHKNNAKDGANPNFSEVDRASKKIHERLVLMKSSMKAIQQQMNEFPADAIEKINQKKHYFYTALNQYFSLFCPEDANMFAWSDMTSESSPSSMQARIPLQNHDPLGDEKKEEQPRLQVDQRWRINQDADVPEASFIFPLKRDDLNEKYVYWDDAKFKEYVYAYPDQEKVELRQYNWRLGGKYDDWMRGYFTRNKKSYEDYQKTAIDFKNMLKQSRSLPEISESVLVLQTQIGLLKIFLDSERPKWRFKLSLWPIQTKGWPFNRSAERFSALLLDELNVMSVRIDAEVALVKLKLQEEANQAEDIQPVGFALQLRPEPLAELKEERREVKRHSLDSSSASQGGIFDRLSAKASVQANDFSTHQFDSATPQKLVVGLSPKVTSTPVSARDSLFARSDDVLAVSASQRFLDFHHSLSRKVGSFVSAQSTAALHVFRDQYSARQSLELCLNYCDQATDENNVTALFQSLLNSLPTSVNITSNVESVQTTLQLLLLRHFLMVILAQQDTIDRQQKMQSFYTECQRQLPKRRHFHSYSSSAIVTVVTAKKESLSLESEEERGQLRLSS